MWQPPVERFFVLSKGMPNRVWLMGAVFLLHRCISGLSPKTAKMIDFWGQHWAWTLPTTADMSKEVLLFPSPLGPDVYLILAASCSWGSWECLGVLSRPCLLPQGNVNYMWFPVQFLEILLSQSIYDLYTLCSAYDGTASSSPLYDIWSCGTVTSKPLSAASVCSVWSVCEPCRYMLTQWALESQVDMRVTGVRAEPAADVTAYASVLFL